MVNMNRVSEPSYALKLDEFYRVQNAGETEIVISLPSNKFLEVKDFLVLFFFF